MAICSSPEWSVIASINSYRKPQHFTSSCNKTFHFVNFKLNSSTTGCSSLIPEEQQQQQAPSIIKFDLNFQQNQTPKLEIEKTNLNEFICNLLKFPKTQDLAYDYYLKAKQNPDFVPEKFTVHHLIRYLIRSKKWGLILSLCDDFKSYNVLPDSYTCSRLVTSCVRARKFKIVERLLDIFKSDSAFDSAMKGYNKLHMYGRTVIVYEKMKSADILLHAESYPQIMEAYRKIGDTDSVVSLFHEFESRKFDSTPYLGPVYKVFCDSLGESGKAFVALEYFRGMVNKGTLENSSMYSSLICSFASIRQVKIVEELFNEAEEKGMLRNPETFQKVVLMYVEENLTEKTLEIVKTMKNVKLKVSDCIFCAIINGFSKRRGFLAAVTVYEDMISQGHLPGQVTYASIINAYCRAGLYSKAEMVFTEMEKRGFDKCVVAYSNIIAMYGKLGRLRDAMRLVAKMKEKGCKPNVWIYNSLMDMHGKVKDIRQVEKLWKEMKRRKVAPDKVSYTSLINAYNKAGLFDPCVEFYREYRLNGGVIDLALAGIMVGVFSKTSQIDELVKLLQDMKSEGTKIDGRLYKSALGALREAGLQVQSKWLQESFGVF